MISRKLPAQNTTAAPACPDFSHGSAGKICPSSGNTLMTSLEKHHLAALVNENKKAQLTWLTLVITAIQVWVGVFSPQNGSGIFKETQKLFSWQEPNLAAGRGKVATDNQRVPEGKELHPSSASSQLLPFSTTWLLDTPISIA